MITVLKKELKQTVCLGSAAFFSLRKEPVNHLLREEFRVKLSRLFISPIILAASVLTANTLQAQETQLQLEPPILEDDISNLEQVTNVNQLRDVSPGDWAYEALRNLVETYGCIAGYPDGTYRGNRAMTRYEFAAGLNACLQQIERLIAASTADFVTKEDLAILQRLMGEFEAELATLGTRVDNLEGRVAFLTG